MAKPTLWILDPPSDLRTIVAFMAQDLGFEVVPIDSLREARRRFESESPAFVIFEAALMEEEAESWIGELRQARPDARVICWTATPEPARIYRLLKLGIHCFRKPGSLMEILRILQLSLK